jgi:CubicO group peptidase (beta-lactamase class C family)
MATCVLVAVSALSPARAAAALDPQVRSRIDALAGPMIEKGVAVGFVIGILVDGEATFLPYGETVRGSGKAPDGNTVYEIGSITKVFTGLLLADAVERGEVALDDPVQRFLPEGTSLPVRGEPVTLAHLASHTSGLPRLPPNMKPADAANPYADYTVEQLLSSIAEVRLERAPGTHEYSNYGMGLLGHLLARHAGRSYEQLLRERVLGPLGMSDTAITLGDDQRRRLAAPYAPGLTSAQNWDLPALAGAGALRSTARDMLDFAAAALARDPEATLAKAFALSMRQRQPIGGGLAIGLGWHIAGDGTTRWHDGGTGGYRSWLAVIPERELAVVVLANTADERIGRFGEDVTRAAAGMDVQPQQIPTEVEVDPSVLATYVGTYQLAPTFALEVTLEGQQLKYPVFASAPGEFFYKVVDARLSFVAGADGSIEKVVLHQGGQDVEGARKR